MAVEAVGGERWSDEVRVRAREPFLEAQEIPLSRGISHEGMVENDEIIALGELFHRLELEACERARRPFDVDARIRRAKGGKTRCQRIESAPALPRHALQTDQGKLRSLTRLIILNTFSTCPNIETG
jgi:hypothetical protein